MRWVSVRVTPARAPDEISSFLFAQGAACVQEVGADLVTSFPESAELDQIERGLRAIDPSATIEVGAPAEFTGEPHGTVTARTVGNLTVAPPWDANKFPAETTIIIEPAGAFGTGEHATTRGVLRLMQISVQKGDVVADLGAGSAVLSIAAAKLGARRVAAIELDADAIPNAEENVALNRVTEVVTVFAGDAAALLPLLAPVDVILANIVSGVLMEILPIIAASLAETGFVILSGILAEEREEMLAELADGDWTVSEEDYEDEWWSVLITRLHIPSFPRSRSLQEARSRSEMK